MIASIHTQTGASIRLIGQVLELPHTSCEGIRKQRDKQRVGSEYY